MPGFDATAINRINDEPRRPRWWWIVAWLAILIGGAGGGTAYNCYQPLDGSVVVLLCFGAGVALLALFCVGVVLTRKLGLHDYPLRGLVGFGVLLGLPLLGLGAAAAFNGALDPHPLVQREVTVVRKKTHRTDGTTIYVADFREGRLGQELGLPGAPDGIKAGDRVVVVLGRGLLGWWYKEICELPARGDPPRSGEAR